MRDAFSVMRVQIPVCAQHKPLLAFSKVLMTESFTTLHVKASVFTSSVKICDAKTRKLMYKMKTGFMSSTRKLFTAEGVVIASIWSTPFENGERVFGGDEIPNPATTQGFRIENQFGPSLIYARFTDRNSGELCTVLVDGESYDSVVIIYLQRGIPVPLPTKPLEPAASRYTGIEPLQRMQPEHFPMNRFEAIARIRHPHSGLHAEIECFIDAAAGVDLALILLLWNTRLEIERRRVLENLEEVARY